MLNIVSGWLHKIFSDATLECNLLTTFKHELNYLILAY